MRVLTTATIQVHTVMFGCYLLCSETASGMSTMAGGRWKETGHFGLLLGWQVHTYSLRAFLYWNKGRYKFNTQQLGWTKSRSSQSTEKALHYTWHFIKNNYLETAIVTPRRDNPRGHVVKFKCSLEKWTGETMLLVKPLSAKSYRFQRG